MRKFTLKFLLTALLLLCSSIVTAHDFEVDGIYYNITDATAKTVEVTYKGNTYNHYTNEYSNKTIIPATITNNRTTYSVTSIGESAFYSCTGLTNVTIPNSVTTIGENAFSYCTGLTSVTIGSGVTTIGKIAFYNCTSLTDVHISNLSAWCNIDFSDPAYITTSNPLYYANNLYLNGEKVTNLVIPDGITTIKKHTFCFGTQFTSVTIPNSVTSIGESAFRGCSGLTSVTIPNSVTSIGESAFYNCKNILDIKNKSYIARTSNENIFSTDTYNNACLYIPNGRKFSYEKTTPWNKFYIVETDFTEEPDKEIIVGDVNGDGSINVADVTALVNIILNGAE